MSVTTPCSSTILKPVTNVYLFKVTENPVTFLNPDRKAVDECSALLCGFEKAVFGSWEDFKRDRATLRCQVMLESNGFVEITAALEKENVV